MGVFSAPDRFNSFFLKPEELTLPQPGSVAFISQSGAFLMQMLGHLGELGVGVHRAVNFGNRIDIGECELLEEFARDPQVRVIGLYLESVQDGPRFMETARAVARQKPVVVLKGGKAERGRQAALAHSASLAGSYSIFKAACEQTGLIEVNGLEQMVDALQLFSEQPKARGDRILVVSNGGGMGVLLTDLCEQAGLQIPEPSPKHQLVLRELYPSYYSFRNPIDSDRLRHQRAMRLYRGIFAEDRRIRRTLAGVDAGHGGHHCGHRPDAEIPFAGKPAGNGRLLRVPI